MTTNGTLPYWMYLGNLSTIPPPPGVQPNFVNPVSLQHYNILTQSICLSVATSLVWLRLYTKSFVLKTLWWDDFTSVAAWVFLVINAYVSFQEDRYGNGRHLWDVTGNDFTNYLQYLYASHILYNITIFTTKLSILLLYLRVFDPNERSRLIFQIVLYANLIFYTIGLFLETFRCSPLQKIWVPLVEPGQCLDQRALQLASCVFNFISDAVILCLPIATIWQLRLSHKSKYGVVAIFSVGILACAIGLIRLIITASSRSPDGTWDRYSLSLWTTAEFTAGIIVGCLPAVPAFIRHLSRFNFKIVTSYVSEHSGTLKRPLQQLTASPRVVESHSDQRPSWEMARIETPKDQL